MKRGNPIRTSRKHRHADHQTIPIRQRARRRGPIAKSPTLRFQQCARGARRMPCRHQKSSIGRPLRGRRLTSPCCVVAGIAEAPLGLSAILLPGAVVAFVVLTQKLAGTVFDLGRGTVRYYSWWRPRTLALADIRDANCEFAIMLSPSRIALAMCGGAGGSKARRGRGGADQRTYMVNLSGTFGSRQVRFYSKRWRGHLPQRFASPSPDLPYYRAGSNFSSSAAKCPLLERDSRVETLL